LSPFSFPSSGRLRVGFRCSSTRCPAQRLTLYPAPAPATRLLPGVRFGGSLSAWCLPRRVILCRASDSAFWLTFSFFVGAHFPARLFCSPSARPRLCLATGSVCSSNVFLGSGASICLAPSDPWATNVCIANLRISSFRLFVRCRRCPRSPRLSLGHLRLAAALARMSSPSRSLLRRRLWLPAVLSLPILSNSPVPSLLRWSVPIPFPPVPGRGSRSRSLSAVSVCGSRPLVPGFPAPVPGFRPFTRPLARCWPSAPGSPHVSCVLPFSHSSPSLFSLLVFRWGLFRWGVWGGWLGATFLVLGVCWGCELAEQC
jgi:hypothetical protein